MTEYTPSCCDQRSSAAQQPTGSTKTQQVRLDCQRLMWSSCSLKLKSSELFDLCADQADNSSCFVLCFNRGLGACVLARDFALAHEFHVMEFVLATTLTLHCALHLAAVLPSSSFGHSTDLQSRQRSVALCLPRSRSSWNGKVVLVRFGEAHVAHRRNRPSVRLDGLVESVEDGVRM